MKAMPMQGGVKIKSTILFVMALLVLFVGLYLYNRYHTSSTMTIKVQEFTPQEYPDNPATKSSHHGQYSHNRLILKQENDSHFTFTFLPGNSSSATIVFKNIDVGLMTPSVPSCIKNNPDLIRISLTDRQWNRQQVSFDVNSPQIKIKGGDGFEKHNLVQAELAKNCLNAGLWEILLFNKENNKKTLLYQGWFTFPLGHYKAIFEKNTGLAYRNHWYYLEHWFDPKGTVVQVDKLRDVIRTHPVQLHYDLNEPVIADGEQVNKTKNIMSINDINTFKDYYHDGVTFSTFAPPGIYRKDKPWKNEFWRIIHPKSAVLNDIKTPNKKHLQEIVVSFTDPKNEPSYFYLSGFDINKLPRLNHREYAKGELYLMGIGTAPLKERYVDLMKNPPETRSEFSIFVNDKGEWINHHNMAIDGSILLLDKNHPNFLHMYLVSYERHAVIAHYWIELPEQFGQ